ncbi:UrcA family protein [Allopontixanthobacter sediminis]|uniref:UrcA family protein n=1 Tax=Allopontixanthobacter sediminis TaxID=1689985 RepID=A0A845B4Y6_9SPHN|nr:UrcA family protein [Allopontixanthobacter sediminis]MXP44487.1 UrcA family protein [Allopontixanthobacter sediminis]
MKSAFFALAAAGSALALMGAVPAAAQSNRDMVIVHSDLNLNSPSGQKTLKRRIDKAAREFCGMDRKLTGSRVRASQDTECYRQAKALATQQMAKLVDDARLGG